MIAKFDRSVGHVYVYVGGEMIASYWGVVGLKKCDNKYLVKRKEGKGIGRISGKAYIKEE